MFRFKVQIARNSTAIANDCMDAGARATHGAVAEGGGRIYNGYTNGNQSKPCRITLVPISKDTDAQKDLAALMWRCVVPARLTLIDLPRPGDALLRIRHHFQPVRHPAHGTGNREHHRKHVCGHL